MADDPNIQSFYKDSVTWTAANNAGTWEAQNGVGLTPQQSNESAIAYGTREAAYNTNKK